MTAKQLETKFADLMDGIIPTPVIRRVMERRQLAERCEDRQGICLVLRESPALMKVQHV
jgi:hypothetical protein